MANATLLRRAAVNTRLPRGFVAEESATPAVCAGIFELIFADFSGSAISSG
jgi:hypothetical protein